ncbi:hypothetical protein ACOMHN_064041 [Nucella lapillus]
MVSEAEVKDEVSNEECNVYSNRRSEIYMRLPLTDNLTADTGSGQLILSGVSTVLLTLHDHPGNGHVYEAPIEGKGKDNVLVSLSDVCRQEL